MKPIVTTSERLTLRSRPWLLGAGLICAMLLFAAIGLNKFMAGDQDEAGKLLLLFGIFAVVFCVFIKQVVVIFDRATDAVVIRAASVFGGREQRHPLSGCKRAFVEKDHNDSSDSKVPTFRPVLEYRDGTKVPLTDIYSGGDGAELAVKAINAWLEPRKG
ncbi:MAG: hypothetical protein ABI832_20305 [bacterium]